MKSLVLALLGILFTVSIRAEPASHASVEQFFELARPEARLEVTYAHLEKTMRAGLQQAISGWTLTDAQKNAVDSVSKEFARVIREELGWQALKSDLLKLYSEVYTQEEVDGLIAFYRSPAGRAFIEKSPVVAQMTMAHMQSKMQAFAPKMEAAMQKAIGDIERAK